MTDKDLPIFLKTGNEQKLNKPTIEDTCDYFLNDKNVKNGIDDLLQFCQTIKMKPGWMEKNGFKCSYKGKNVVTFKISKDYFRVTIAKLAEKEDLDKVLSTLSPDAINEIFDRKDTHCKRCTSDDCIYGGASIKIKGKKYVYCSRFNYICINPAPGQLCFIKQFITIRRENIDSIKQ